MDNMIPKIDVTDVTLKFIDHADDRVPKKALANVVLNNQIYLRGLWVIKDSAGKLFVGYPSFKHRPTDEPFFPYLLESHAREIVEKAILNKYNEHIAEVSNG